MTILEKVGRIVLALACIGFVVYLRILSMKNMEDRRDRKSDLQGLFKKLD